MQQYFPIILASGVLAFLGTPMTRLLAQRLGMVAQPGPRKVHRWPVPLLGGLAMYVALALTFVLFGNLAWLTEMVGIFGGATLMFLVGLWDDRHGMPAWLKMAAQVMAVICLLAVGIQVHLVDLWGVNWIITFLWVIGITNAVNLMDNMDGLAAGVTAIGGAAFFILAALEGQGLVSSLAAALCGAALGFLFYNTAPAISFMGDAGALMLGFVLAVLGIKLKFLQYSVGSTWMAPIVVLGVLIFDTTLVTFSRWRRGIPIYHGGSDHTSHRLVRLGMSQPRAVLSIYLAAGALGALALYLTRSPVLTANLAFAGLCAVGLVLLLIFERIEPTLSGDPPIVLIPGGDPDWAARVREAHQISHNLTLLLAPRQSGVEVRPTAAEVADVVVALAEDAAAVKSLLARGLGDHWWQDVNQFNRALRLTGTVIAVYDTPLGALPEPAAVPANSEPQAEAAAALRRAKLIVLGPGRPDVNLLPVLAAPGVMAALQESQGSCLWVCGDEAPGQLTPWVGKTPQTASPLDWSNAAQQMLLAHAATHAKTAQ
jgi:UDP-GlcNAc:undecaprenyl-phosphate/decaprenyl-phosphate GlcNAc-1-phosphate transferase